MKKPSLRPLNKVLIAALAVFFFFFVKSLMIVFSGYRFDYQEPKAAPALSGLKNESLPQLLEMNLFNKLKERNFFLSALVAVKKTPGSAPGEPVLPPLGENEVRDQATGATFKYLGTITLSREPLAFFRKLGTVPKGEPKYLLLPKGKPLSKNIRIEDVGEKGVKVNQGGQKTNLNIFYLNIKQFGNEKKIT